MQGHEVAESDSLNAATSWRRIAACLGKVNSFRKIQDVQTVGMPYPFICVSGHMVSDQISDIKNDRMSPDLGCQKRCVVAAIMPSFSFVLDFIATI